MLRPGALLLIAAAAGCAPPSPAPPAERSPAEPAAETAATAPAQHLAAPQAEPEAPAQGDAQPAAAPAATAAATAPSAAPARIYAKTRFVWVHYNPSVSSGWLGFLWLGGYAELKSGTPLPGRGGCGVWYEVKPRGYVCGEGDGVTLDPADPTLVALLPYAPKKDSPWPHRYGESKGVDRYVRQPTVDDQRGREYLYDEHMKRVAEARAGGALHKSLEGIDLTPGDPAPLTLPLLPRTLREQRRRLLPLSTVAWSRDYVDADGRSWLLSADFVFTPKDRVAPYPISEFHGVALGDKVKLPLAFFRERARPQYAPDDEGGMRPTGQQWPRLAWVQLTGRRRQVGGSVYLETEAGPWVDLTDAVLPQPQATTPWGAPVGEEDRTGRAPSGRQTWIEISILGGWMIAYEGTRPVYVTMISPGRGGLPMRGVDPIETAATPVGSWPVTGKFVTATMVAPHEFIHSDVPWAQNFHGPHALHAAYWHDGWGEKKSAGCVNLSNTDAKWLFDWTEPPLPEGWHGIRWEKDLSPATQVITHQ